MGPEHNSRSGAPQPPLAGMLRIIQERRNRKAAEAVYQQARADHMRLTERISLAAAAQTALPGGTPEQHIKPQRYGVGLHLQSELTEGHLLALRFELRAATQKRWPSTIYSKMFSRGSVLESITIEGQAAAPKSQVIAPSNNALPFRINVPYPIIDIDLFEPPAGLPQQLADDLRYGYELIASYAFATVQATLWSAAKPPQKSWQSPPHILDSDPHPTHLLELWTSYGGAFGFSTQHQAAKVVSQMFAETNTIASIRQAAPTP